ncbi:MAG: glucose-1-phosphate thymidylyltransferase RfbA [Clostridia bacterium]|jgi:glucose-1-phosphate thymidylyltransferase|nr:glucose-1-phosphate thymidylyltransferase RfbA [Clostridia bacterium]
MKGIVLSGGSGTRLYPITKSFTKQLLPIYDKPMIYYPLSVLMLSGIKDILIITTPDDIHLYKKLLGDGSQLGVKFSYLVQEKPKGIAQAFVVGESFIGSDNVCLVLGDNIFHGTSLVSRLNKAAERKTGATVFGYAVKNPKDFGVVSFDKNGKALEIVEKPQNPKSNYAVPGLYFYDNRVVEIAKSIEPSARGEYEITSVNNEYLRMGELNVVILGRGTAWLDTGTPEGMLKASEYVGMVQERQGYYIACLEEIAWRKGYIDTEQFRSLGEQLKKSDYGQYILSMANRVVDEE